MATHSTRIVNLAWLLMLVLLATEGTLGSLTPSTNIGGSKLKVIGILDKLQSLKNNGMWVHLRF
jgi:hypothetical protein